jgi:hypothetical protein
MEVQHLVAARLYSVDEWRLVRITWVQAFLEFTPDADWWDVTLIFRSADQDFQVREPINVRIPAGAALPIHPDITLRGSQVIVTLSGRNYESQLNVKWKELQPRDAA